MIKPSLDVLLDKVESKYALVVMAAKRAREITEELGNADHPEGVKSVTLALEEVAAGKIKYEKVKEGIE